MALGGVPGNLSGSGAVPVLPAFEPVPPSASFSAMLGALQGQRSLQPFLPSAGVEAGNGGVATPGGGTTGAPALPSSTPGAVPWASRLGEHLARNVSRLDEVPGSVPVSANFQGATPTVVPPASFASGFRFPGSVPAGAQGLSGLFANWLGSFNGAGGVQGPSQTPVVTPAPPSSTSASLPVSPWASLAQWFKSKGGPVGQL